MNYPAVTINEIDLSKAYKALLMELHSVQPPVSKKNYQDILGADGTMDLSIAITSRPTYERRLITMHFNCEHTLEAWSAVCSELLSLFHGKEGKIIFGDDPSYYYVGPMEVVEYKRVVKVGQFTVTAYAEPYKYELLSSVEPWKWDPFSFRKGIIRNYKDLNVNGERQLNIRGAEKWVIPVFIANGNISVTFEGKTYELKAGKSKIYPITIKPGINTLIFRGNGIVSVDYRGGIL